jgi:hypothetical protein
MTVGVLCHGGRQGSTSVSQIEASLCPVFQFSALTFISHPTAGCPCADAPRIDLAFPLKPAPLNVKRHFYPVPPAMGWLGKAMGRDGRRRRRGFKRRRRFERRLPSQVGKLGDAVRMRFFQRRDLEHLGHRPVVVFFVIELKSRAVHIAGIRVAPDDA